MTNREKAIQVLTRPFNTVAGSVLLMPEAAERLVTGLSDSGLLKPDPKPREWWISERTSQVFNQKPPCDHETVHVREVLGEGP